ncbi:hypothetical protein HBA92_06710 [Ochrobactrum sp. MR28]|nr:hypothetical protein [Ochrobactrum sp. MR28]MBX8816238.1 hypothetical protein [Ochrobactrum sp. MR31]
MPLNQAAAYCGLSIETFKEVCPIKPVSFTPSTRGQRFLRQRLDEWLSSLDRNADYSNLSALEAWKARKHARTS